jgi:thiamine biosynthesis lipoprotein
LQLVSSQQLELDPQAGSVRLLHRGMALNFGAIGKGYALDRAAEALDAGGLHDFLIHGGNSSVLARGGREANAECGIRSAEFEDEHSAFRTPHSAFWTVALRHPRRPDVRRAEFVLCNQALGTSGSGTQFFHHQGQRYGHIIDPRTGWPADKVLSATVIAPTAEQADALSTALYVMGLDRAREFCAAHSEISALLTTQSGAGRIELHPLNLSDDRWRVID